MPTKSCRMEHPADCRDLLHFHCCPNPPRLCSHRPQQTTMPSSLEHRELNAFYSLDWPERHTFQLDASTGSSPLMPQSNTICRAIIFAPSRTLTASKPMGNGSTITTLAHLWRLHNPSHCTIRKAALSTASPRGDHAHLFHVRGGPGRTL